MHLLLLLLIAAAPAFLFSGATLAGDNKGGEVLELSNNNLNDTIKDNSHLCVLFYLPVGNTKLYQEFMRAAATLKKENSIIKLAKYDINNDPRKIFKEYKVNKNIVQILLFFRDHKLQGTKSVKDEKELLKAADIVAWLKSLKDAKQ